MVGGDKVLKMRMYRCEVEIKRWTLEKPGSAVSFGRSLPSPTRQVRLELAERPPARAGSFSAWPIAGSVHASSIESAVIFSRFFGVCFESPQEWKMVCHAAHGRLIDARARIRNTSLRSLSNLQA